MLKLAGTSGIFRIACFSEVELQTGAQKVENRDFKNDAISLDRVQVLHFSGSCWASKIEEVAVGLTK